MKTFVATAAGAIFMSILGITPVSAVEPVVEPVISGVAFKAPITSLSFDKVSVVTAAAPVFDIVVPVPVIAIAAPVTAPGILSSVSLESYRPIADAVEAQSVGEVVLTADGINPECAEQSMQTGQNGSCLPTECAEAGQVLDSEGNCGPVMFVTPITEDNGQVADNGNPACDVAGAIQYSDGSCTFAAPAPVEDDVWVQPMPGETPEWVQDGPVAPAEGSTGDTAPACDELEIGEACAGVGTHCKTY